ncbi:MAG: glycoside hydrolase family 2 protein [Candidatus Helarchaeota archaeon]
MSLNGDWKYKIDETNIGIKDQYWKTSLDDSNWHKMKIPSNWYLNGLDYNGVVWYRYEFDLDYSNTDKVLLKFIAVDYHAKIWLNDNYLGEHEGYFGSFEFEISRYIKKTKNLLAVRCCAPYDPGFPFKKKLFKGGLVHWDLRPGTVSIKGQDKGSGGIWQPVIIKIFQKVKIENLLISPIFQDKFSYIQLDFELFNFENNDLNILIRCTISPFNFSGETEVFEWSTLVSPKRCLFNFKIQLQDPKFWWTWDLGNPNLYTLKLELFHKNKLINSTESKFGIRNLVEKKDSWYLNNVPIFLRGSNYFSSCWLSEMDSNKFEKDINLIKQANMNILRVGYHVEPQIFYDICDEHGILIWQDFPMLWDYDIKRTKEACIQMKELVIQYYNHPSIAIFCCHCEPLGLDQKVLDKSLQNVIKYFDKSNRKIFLSAKHSDHPFVGWYYSTYYNFLTLPGGKNPNEFGAQSLPSLNSKFWEVIPPEAKWPYNKIWDYYDFQRFITLYIAEILKNHKGGINFQDFIKYSQEYQAKLLKFGIEAFRRGKGKIHGCILFTFNDAWPSITWSIVDYYRNPKLAYYSVQKAFQPLLCSIELPTPPVPDLPNIHAIVLNLRELFIAPLKALFWNENFTRNSMMKLNLWIINDFNREIKDAFLKVEILNKEKLLKLYKFKLNIPASSKIFIKKIEYKFDKHAKLGQYNIRATIHDSEKIISTNEFSIYVVSTWKKIKKSIFRFFGIYKGYLASILGQEIQIKTIINSLLGKFKKLAKNNWCID